MSIVRAVRLGVWSIALISTALLTAGTSRAAPADACRSLDPADVNATAALNMVEQQSGNAIEVVTTLTVDVPERWDGSRLLLSEQPPLADLPCIPGYPDYGQEVIYHSQLKGDRIVLTSSNSERYGGFYSDGIWSVSSDSDQGPVRIEFDPQLDKTPNFDWHAVEVHVLESQKILEVSPTPSVFTERGDISWTSQVLQSSPSVVSAAGPSVTLAAEGPLAYVGQNLDGFWIFDAFFGLVVYCWTFFLFRRRARPWPGEEGAERARFDADLLAAGRLLSIGGIVSSLVDVRYFYYYPFVIAATLSGLLAAVLLLTHLLFWGVRPRGVKALWVIPLILVVAAVALVSDFDALTFLCTVLVPLSFTALAIRLRRSSSNPYGMSSRDDRAERSKHSAQRWIIAAALGAVVLFASGIISGYSLSAEEALHLVMLQTVAVLLLVRSQGSLVRIIHFRQLFILLIGLTIAGSAWWDLRDFDQEQALALALVVSGVSVSFLFWLRRFSVLEQIGGEDALNQCEPIALDELQRQLVKADGLLKTVIDEMHALDKKVQEGKMALLT